MSVIVGIFLAWYVVFVFSATCHEAGHAWAAMRGGDSTAYEGGQVSLDPLPHIRREPFGMILVPVASFALIGMTSGWENAWMLGWASAPYNASWAQRYPRRHAWMSLAGPAANFLLAGVSFGVLKAMMSAGMVSLPARFAYTQVLEAPAGNYGSTLGAVTFVLSLMLILNLLLGLFNLIPFPPLDGASIAEGFGPEPVKRLFALMREQPMFGLIGLLIAWKLFPFVWGPAVKIVVGLLWGIPLNRLL